MNKRTTGAKYEDEACEYLSRAGLKVIERNYRNRNGEIDIVALDGDCYVFVEVKYRSNNSKGNPVEAVNYRKKYTICRVADYYRICHGGLNGMNIRFDVISILKGEITWYKNAFSYIPAER